MMTITREQKDGRSIFRLTGMINETVDLKTTIGALPSQVTINCGGISQINSLGVKAWIDFFTEAANARVQFTFAECPPPIVEQLNFISNFACGGSVTSVAAPFTCEKCFKELRGIVSTEDLKRVNYQLPPIQCPKCKSKAFFDDTPEEYFSFLIRQKSDSR